MFEALVSRIEDLAKKVSATPTFTWATITSLDPLRLRLDGDESPLIITPSIIYRPSSVGERVLCVIVYRRCIILGPGGGPGRRDVYASTGRTDGVTTISPDETWTRLVTFGTVALPPGIYAMSGEVMCRTSGNALWSLRCRTNGQTFPWAGVSEWEYHSESDYWTGLCVCRSVLELAEDTTVELAIDCLGGMNGNPVSVLRKQLIVERQ